MIAKYFVPAIEAASDREIIEKLGNILVEHKNVVPEYIEKVEAAENDLSTGIDLENISIAIPHANNFDLIKKPAIAIGILKKPVQFGSMIVVSETVPVNIVFLLAINNSDEQLAVFARLMKAFQDAAWLKRVYNAKTQNELTNIFNEIDIDGQEKLEACS